MKVFVAYGFNDRDKQLRDLVVRLIEAVGAQAVTGEFVAGEVISEAVKEKIVMSDGLIALLTARDEPGTADETHRWGIEELAIADNNNVKAVEVREVGLTNQGGIRANRQHVKYDPNDQVALVIELASALANWSRGLTLRGILLPPDLALKIARAQRRSGFKCTYSLLEGGRQSEPQDAVLVQRPGGLELRVRGIPAEALISVQVWAEGKSYSTDHVGVDALPLQLIEEQ